MEDYTVGVCPNCGGRLYVDVQYPDDIRCDTCDYEGFSITYLADLARLDFVDFDETKKKIKFPLIS